MNTILSQKPYAAPTGKKTGTKCLALLILLSLTLLTGCFDYELELALQKDGSGTLSAILVTPDTTGPPPAKLMDMLLPNPVRKITKVGKRLVTKDTGKFDFLDAVALYGFSVHIKETSFGVLGMTDHTYRVTLSLYPVEGDRPDRKVLPGTERETRTPDPEPTDPALKRSRAMVKGGLKGSCLIVTYRLPGEIKNPLSLTLGSSLIKPEISQGKTRVSWRIPWSVLINEKVNHTLEFVADYKGDLEFRVPGQTVIHTHVPSPEELAQIKEAKKQAEEEEKAKEADSQKTEQDKTGDKKPPLKDQKPAPGTTN